MEYFSLHMYPTIGVLMFVVTVSMHLYKKNASVVVLYALQSFLVSAILFLSSLAIDSVILMFVACTTFAIKAIVAPSFFLRLIKKHQLMHSVSSYLNGPMTLIVLALLVAIPFSSLFQPLTILAEGGGADIIPRGCHDVDFRLPHHQSEGGSLTNGRRAFA